MAAYILSPEVVALNAAGTGSVQKVQAASTNHGGIQYVYKVNAQADDNLFKAFDITDVGADVNSTDLTITLDFQKFHDRLAALMDSATGGKLSTNATAYSGQASSSVTANNTLNATMVAEVIAEVKTFLNGNSVTEFLEGDTISDFSLTIDSSAGATNMYNAINNAAHLKCMFLQIPDRPTWGGNTETNKHYSQLPVVAGDEISFVFDLSTGVTITEVPVSLSATGSQSGSAPNLTTANYTTLTRRVQFVIQVQ